MFDHLRMAIIRPIGIPISRNFYNSQEIGLARGLSKYGISVDVYVAGKDQAVVCQNIESAGSGLVRLFEVPFFKIPLIDHAIYPKLISLLKEGSYNFIQVNEENELTSFWVARYARKNGIPVVVYQGMYEQLTGRIYAAFQNIYDTFLLPLFRKYIDVALVKTSRARAHLERKGFNNIRILPVGLDPTPFKNPKDRNWRSEFDIPPEAYILLYVGVFEKRRNVDFMLDLAKSLLNYRVYLVMAGVGPEHERITSRISKENILNVRLIGSVSQDALPSLYRESSLFLLPSKYEIYGMVVIEAMYFGLPLISTRTAGPEDIIDNNVDGIIMDYIDVEMWAKSILSLQLKPEKQIEMRSNSKIKFTVN
ncbi:D-inositol 3-phosphate glycosyltransferase [Geobacter sp. OR-1]|uniref:glycosyltransferase family 4 protein n=1 Tax=Geobacter sp. OR-1 TaxID=1266765 RepID=UPI00054211DE|nr:glycosyltransferase family 4 protein [Geobacter sp. OR-1]GAM11865.1 D-inositol 3-phosphate glycosyltransferase [Geobacter sp. OR-1]